MDELRGYRTLSRIDLSSTKENCSMEMIFGKIG